MYIAKFMQGDTVVYTGEQLRAELNGKVGWVHARVIGVDGVFVVEFPDTKEGDSYVIGEASLKRHFSTDRTNGPEVAPRRHKRDDDNDGKSKERKG